jgi:hypothetical protein
MAQQATSQAPNPVQAADMADRFVDLLSKLDADIEIVQAKDKEEAVKRKTFPGLKLGKEIPSKRDMAINSFTADQFDMALKQIIDAQDHFDNSRAGYARKSLVSTFDERLAAAKVDGVKLEEIEPVLIAFDEYTTYIRSTPKLAGDTLKMSVDKAWAVVDAFAATKEKFQTRVAAEADDRLAKARQMVAAKISTKTTKKT